VSESEGARRIADPKTLDEIERSIVILFRSYFETRGWFA
jgi:hypothetical protein